MTIDNKLIDELLKGYKKPEDLIGKNKNGVRPSILRLSKVTSEKISSIFTQAVLIPTRSA